jgi:hypothetical protein
MTDFDDIYLNELNRHGYPFQNSVMRTAQELFETGKSRWVFKATEFPASVRERVTHIDFILAHLDKPLFLIAECKRVNPALSNWCFARNAFTVRNPRNSRLIIQAAWLSGTASNRFLTGISTETAEQIYHLGVEIKSNKKGDAQGQPKGGLEKAGEQVCLGVNGMVEFFAAHPNLLPEGKKIHLVPVIFTTAQIFTSEIDLGSANLESGELDNIQEGQTNRPWIWWQHNLSPALVHGQSVRPVAQRMELVLEQEFSRSIAIVSPQGIESFLGRDWWLDSERNV